MRQDVFRGNAPENFGCKCLKPMGNTTRRDVALQSSMRFTSPLAPKPPASKLPPSIEVHPEASVKPNAGQTNPRTPEQKNTHTRTHTHTPNPLNSQKIRNPEPLNPQPSTICTKPSKPSTRNCFGASPRTASSRDSRRGTPQCHRGGSLGGLILQNLDP